MRGRCSWTERTSRAARPEIVRRGIGRAFQIASIFPSLTVREAILGAVNAHRGWYARLCRRFPLGGGASPGRRGDGAGRL